MLNSQDYLWFITNKLIKDNEYSLLQLKGKNNSTQDLQSIHLIKNNRREYIYIRLMPVNFLWPNHLYQDLEDNKNYAYNLKKQMFGFKIKFLNLYIFQSIPTEEIHQAILKDSRYSEQGIDFYCGYIDLENKKIGTPENTFEELKLTKETFLYYFSNPADKQTEDLKTEINLIEAQRDEEIKEIFNYGKPIFTYILIAINTLVFIMLTYFGGSEDIKVLLNFGAKEAYFISQGEYWRLITSIFLHSGFSHFIFNNFFLYILGKTTEKIYGSARFIVIYFMAGIIGNIVSILYAPSTISVGASGAIYGLYGAIIYFGYIYPNLFFRTLARYFLPMLAVNIVFSFFAENVGTSAHFGGLIGGFLVAAIISLPKRKKQIWATRSIAIILTISLLILGYWGIFIRDFKSSQLAYIKGDEAIQKGNISQAYDIYQHLVKYYPDIPYFNFQYANIVFQQGNHELAKEFYLKTLELEPNYPEAHYNLALLYHFNNDKEQAIYHLEKALEINSNYSDAKKLLEYLKNESN